MAKIKVQSEQGLIRETESNAILLTDSKRINDYQTRRNQKIIETQEINKLKARLELLENQIATLLAKNNQA